MNPTDGPRAPEHSADPTGPDLASGPDDIVDAEIIPDDKVIVDLPGPGASSGDATVSPAQIPAADSRRGGSAEVGGGAPGGLDGPVTGLDYTLDGVPTLDYVRARIEGRLGSAAGASELAEAELARTAEADPKSVAAAARAAEQRAEDREQAARDRLAQIRRGMGS